jgi:hypothetical protein
MSCGQLYVRRIAANQTLARTVAGTVLAFTLLPPAPALGLSGDDRFVFLGDV